MRESRVGWTGFAGIALGVIAGGCLSPDAYPGEPSADGNPSGELCSHAGSFDGPSIEGVQGAWAWVDVPEARCRNGSSTGFGVRLNRLSDKLFIYFDGDGACFNWASCEGTNGSYSSQDFNKWKGLGGRRGIFDTSKVANTLKDWSVVYVPYCTGDLHAGNATGVDVPGLTGGPGQSFVGYANVGLFLERIVPTFPKLAKILVTGVGAGGPGAMFNFHRIAQAFCSVPAILINDSGPLMDDKYLEPCLQAHWRELWGMNANLPEDCVDCSPANGGGIVNYMDYLGARHPGSRLALISSMNDEVGRQFYGFGQSNCAALHDVVMFPARLPEPTYAEGLADLRANHMNGPASWASYYIPGNGHRYLDGNKGLNATVQGTRLVGWVADVVDNGPMANVGP